MININPQRCQYKLAYTTVLYTQYLFELFYLVTRIRFLYRPDLYSIFFILSISFFLPLFLSLFLFSLFYIFTSPAGFVGSWSCYRGYIGGGVGGGRVDNGEIPMAKRVE